MANDITWFIELLLKRYSCINWCGCDLKGFASIVLIGGAESVEVNEDWLSAKQCGLFFSPKIIFKTYNQCIFTFVKDSNTYLGPVIVIKCKTKDAFTHANSRC